MARPSATTATAATSGHGPAPGPSSSERSGAGMADTVPTRTYPATVEGWTDGDTLTAAVDCGFYITTRQRFRLLGSAGGVDTPELHDADPAARARAQRARARAAELAPPGARVTLYTAKADSFGRFLARVVTAAGLDVGDALLAEGHAAVWRG